MWLCARECQYPWGPEEGVIYPRPGVAGSVCVLRTKLQSSSRARLALYHWTIPPSEEYFMFTMSMTDLGVGCKAGVFINRISQLSLLSTILPSRTTVNQPSPIPWSSQGVSYPISPRPLLHGLSSPEPAEKTLPISLCLFLSSARHGVTPRLKIRAWK